jgi:hypothetical protein
MPSPKQRDIALLFLDGSTEDEDLFDRPDEKPLAHRRQGQKRVVDSDQEDLTEVQSLKNAGDLNVFMIILLNACAVFTRCDNACFST